MRTPFAHRPPRWLIPLLGSLVAFGPLSIDMYLPALPAMAQELRATQGQIQSSLVAFFAGFCIGMLLYGPLSDQLGRRKLLLSGMLLFVVASGLCALAQSAQQLMLLRALQAFGSGAAVVMARAIARDVFAPSDLPRVLSLMTLVTMLAPLIAPLIGGVLVSWFNWRAIFLLLTLIGCVSGALVFWVLPETLPPQAAGGRILNAFRHYRQLLTDRQAMSAIGTLAFSFGGMFAFISASPFIYIEYFHVPAALYGLLFGANVIGMILVLLVNVQLLKRYQVSQLLWIQSCAQLAFGLLLLMFHGAGLAVTVMLVVLFVSLVNAIGANSLSLLLQQQGQQAGSASALAVSLQFAAGAAAGLAVSLLQSSTPFVMALVMAVCAALSWLCQRLTIADRRSFGERTIPGETKND